MDETTLRVRLSTPKCVFFTDIKSPAVYKYNRSCSTPTLLAARVPDALVRAHSVLDFEAERPGYINDIVPTAEGLQHLERIDAQRAIALYSFSDYVDRTCKARKLFYGDKEHLEPTLMTNYLYPIDGVYVKHVQKIVKLVRSTLAQHPAPATVPSSRIVDTFSPLMPTRCEVVLLRAKDGITVYTVAEWKATRPDTPIKEAFGPKLRVAASSIATFEDDYPDEDQNPQLLDIPIEKRKMVRFVPAARTHGDLAIRDAK